SGRRERGNFGERHGRGHRAGGSGGDLRGIPAGRDRGQEGGRHRARPGPVREVHRAAWREDLGREPDGGGFYVHIHDPDANWRLRCPWSERVALDWRAIQPTVHAWTPAASCSPRWRVSL